MLHLNIYLNELAMPLVMYDTTFLRKKHELFVLPTETYQIETVLFNGGRH